jgi:hypothetical protein
MSVIINGDTGITTPAETVQGALTTTGNTILGDATTDTLTVGVTGIVKDASGNVGIGTASPSAKLQLDTTSDTIFRMNTGGTNIGYLEAYTGGATPLFAMYSVPSNGNMTFGTNNTERMRIDSSGDLLVGTTSSTGRLTIKGVGTSSATKALWTSNSAGSELLYVRDDGAIYTGAGAASPYSLTSAAAANMIVAADRFIYRSTSALKYKQNVRDLPSIDINKFRPVVYNSKCSGDNQAQDYFGIIADEVDAAGVKELVTYGIDGEVEGFQYERLTVVLLKAIQEQQALITQLHADVATLKALKA